MKTLILCSICQKEDHSREEWYEEKDLPTHLFRKHNHPRIRPIDDIKRDWSILGLLEIKNSENN